MLGDGEFVLCHDAFLHIGFSVSVSETSWLGNYGINCLLFDSEILPKLPLTCEERWKKFLSASLIDCLNFFRRISNGSSRHEHRAAKACMASSAMLREEDCKGICKYLDYSSLK